MYLKLDEKSWDISKFLVTLQYFFEFHTVFIAMFLNHMFWLFQSVKSFITYDNSLQTFL